MTKEETKAMFEKMRAEQTEYVEKNITDKPSAPGSYNIQVEGVRYVRAMFLDFDGQNWLDLNSVASDVNGELSKISYFEKVPSQKSKPTI